MAPSHGVFRQELLANSELEAPEGPRWTCRYRAAKDMGGFVREQGDLRYPTDREHPRRRKFGSSLQELEIESACPGAPARLGVDLWTVGRILVLGGQIGLGLRLVDDNERQCATER